MNKKNLFTVFLLILIMLCGITAYAETNDVDPIYEKGKFFMETFGVDTEGLEYDSPVSRGFVAKAISNILFDELTVTPAMTKFADVPSTSPYASAAFLLSSSGIMNGDGTNFNPETDITYTQAAKVFVVAMGQDVVAQSKGGWPHGYLAVATSNKIFDGISVKTDDTLTFGDFAKMYYNFTDCKGFVQTWHEFGVYCQEDITLLEHKLARCDMKYIEGVVTGNSFGSVSSNEMGKLTIDGIEYDVECDVDSELIGYYVDVFLRRDFNKYVVVAVKQDYLMNNVRTLKGDEIENVSTSEVRYYDGDNVRRLRLRDLSVVRNGRILTRYTNADLSPLNGGLKLVDNNRDGKYEYLCVENRQYYIVSRTSAEKNVVILEDERYEGSSHLYINPDDKEFYHRIYKADGTPAEFSDIKAGGVIRIEGIREQNMLKVYIIEDVFDGKVEQISSEDYQVIVGGQLYDVAKAVNGDRLADINTLTFNSSYTFTADNGYIVNIEKIKSESKYAYVIDTKPEPGLSDSIKYKLVSEDGQLYIGELADKITHNGTRKKLADFTPTSGTVIKYQVDSDGKICAIDDAVIHTAKKDKKYNASGIITSAQYEFPIFMDDNTKMFIVPDSGLDDDYMANFVPVDGKTYSCESYDYDEDTLSIGAIVFYDDITYETPGYIYEDSPVCVLKSKLRTLDEEGESAYKLTWMQGTEEVSKYIKETPRMLSIVNKMSAGDVFQYAETSRGFVNNIDTHVMLDQNPSYFYNGEMTNVERVYGKVIDVKSKTFTRGYINSFVNIYTLELGNGEKKSFVVNCDEKVEYYVFDSATKEVKAASIDDIMYEDGVLGTFSASDVYIYFCPDSTAADKNLPVAQAVVIKN